MAYRKTDAKVNFPKIEKEVSAGWKENNTFHKVRDKNKNGADFIFFDGPATPSSIPHMGHLGVSAAKDMVCRYNNMLGNNVVHKLGWDVHGLPTEIMVEKETGKQAKDLVAEYGVEEFCNMCKKGVMKCVNDWEVYLNRIGRWLDIGDGDIVYNTMYPEYMESVIWGIKRIYDMGLLYKDFKVNPFDWALGTVISNSEASSEYEDVIDDAITVWFELDDKRRILAWTTTPWTLLANSALAVNPALEYSVLQDKDGAEYIIAKSRLKAYEKQFENMTEIKSIKGSEIVGKSYKPLFDFYDDKKLHKVIAAEYVSDDSGTGIVHLAPAFGEEDYLALKKIDADFPVIVNVDDYGNFTEEVGEFAGKNIFVANPLIIEFIQKAGHLVKKENYKHSYPFSPRSKEKLIYRATEAWYIDVPKIRDRLIELNNQVDWKSSAGRFSSWIENARPWGISRNRFWGVPLPIWTNQNGEYKVFGSVKELQDFFGVEIKDLHRASLDALEKDGWKRIPDVLDAWFESGAMPFAHLHYPFENKEIVDNPGYMSDYIVEGQDQTRGWFYTLMVLSTILFDRPAFKTISANGMTVDEHKKKMSKSLGNYVDPISILDTYGADATRLYILGSNFLKSEPVPIDKEGKVFAETIKTTLTPFWNAYHFFTLYANAGNIKAKRLDDYSSADNIMDKYILGELNQLFKIAKESLNAYQPDILSRRIIEFLDILNNWYIRRSRMRFWNENQEAFDTLYTVLIDFSRVIAPLAPFVSEYIYKELTGKESVHLQEYPKYKENPKSAYLEKDMRKVQAIVSVGKQLREEHKLRNRQPLSSLTVAGVSMPEYADIIQDELNVKNVIFTDNIKDFADSFVYLITPKIGERLGAALRDIIPAVKRMDYKLSNDKLIVAGHTLNKDEFEERLTVKNNVIGSALSDNTAVIILDTNLVPELVAEGLANDVLRFIQDTRKEIGLDVSDRIHLIYEADPELSNPIETHREKIMLDVLANKMSLGAGKFETEIEGFKIKIDIKKV